MTVLISNDAELPTLIAEEEIRAIAAHVLAAEGVEREVEISTTSGVASIEPPMSSPLSATQLLTMSFLPMNSSSLAMSSWRPR